MNEVGHLASFRAAFVSHSFVKKNPHYAVFYNFHLHITSFVIIAIIIALSLIM